jgi:hypothetical protein
MDLAESDMNRQVFSLKGEARVFSLRSRDNHYER